MKSKINIIFLCVIFAGTVSSCLTVSGIAHVAGTTGFVNRNTASAISTSAKAIGSAAEEINPEQEYYIGRAVAANILSSYRLYTENQRLTAY
jgi:beta-barrel assembly-enhancing protease